jgi:hypothetical protein
MDLVCSNRHVLISFVLKTNMAEKSGKFKSKNQDLVDPLFRYRYEIYKFFKGTVDIQVLA